MKIEKNDEVTEQDLMQSAELTLSDEIVVSYLQDNPDIFNRHSELLTSLRVSDHQRGTVSLVERQQQQLRQKIHSLEEEITQLMSIANQNEQLFALYSDLYIHLLDCDSAEDLLNCLYKTTTELLSLADLKLWLKQPVKLNHPSLVNNDCAGVMQNRLTKEEYYFGRLQQSEQQLIFSQPTTGSVVLVKLTHLDKELGFIAISSADDEHFDPRMDTLLLSQFRKLIAKLLQQQLSL
ncbi:MAG: hypothetical protein ACI9LM_002468 [Alteromonadaceae bacterium]|jgi:uncharacterized protein YigA (DUF484 family)